MGIPIVVIPHSPHVVSGDGCYSSETGIMCAGIGAGHNAPPGPVPVLYQRVMSVITVMIMPHSPHVVSGCCCYSSETIRYANIRAGHYTPLGPVPVLC